MLHLPKLYVGLKSAVEYLQPRHIISYSKIVLLFSLLTTGTVMGVRSLGWLQLLELDAYDQMLQRQPPMALDSRMVVVGITEDDIETYGWPVPDEVMARALVELQQHRPSVIGFDLHRNIAHPPGTEQLRSQLAASNVINIETLGGDNAIPAPTGISPQRVGFNNFLPDSDNVVRRNLMVVLFGDDERYSFALRVSQSYLAHRDIELTPLPDGIQLGATTFHDLETTSGSYHNLHPGGYQILTRYHSNIVPSEQLSLSQVLSGDINPALFQDRIVLVGTVAPSIKDLFYTPYSDRAESSQTAGVIIHAHFINHILRAVLDQERLIWFTPDWVEGLWVLGWGIVGGTVAWGIRNPLLIAVGVIATGGLLIGSSYLVFLQAGWIPLWPALLALVATSGVVFTYDTLYKLFYDTLTALPQKTLFLRSVKQSIAPSAMFRLRSTSPERHCGVMLSLDLDGFKRINESLGHEEGDRILLTVTRRVKQILPRNSQFSRLMSSDKFVVWVDDLPQEEDAIALARSIQDSVKQPITINQQEVVMSASVGIALKTADNIRDADGLLRDAQTAMHQAKSRGKSQIEVFNSNMRLNIIAHFQTEADLRYAIERQELRTYYQPFISLQTGNIAGFEALVRWQHPQHGLVSPGKFIPVAEDTDLIIPIGHWILQEACQQMHHWHTTFPAQPPLIISVNLSGRQFTQPDLVQNIKAILEQTGLEGQYLKLELTESILMDDVEAVIDTLNQMKQLDLKVSIDDFGTGYSSLSYLHRFPINTLKVDRSFVMHIDEMGEDHAIVETIIALGHHLKMDVIAEGIETAEQARKLKDLQCEYGQGYFFARPMPADEIEELLAKEKFWLAAL